LLHLFIEYGKPLAVDGSQRDDISLALWLIRALFHHNLTWRQGTFHAVTGLGNGETQSGFVISVRTFTCVIPCPTCPSLWIGWP